MAVAVTSSPGREFAGAFCKSAPCSPARASSVYADFTSAMSSGGGDGNGYDFAFDFSNYQLEKEGGSSPALSTADELFEAGRIRALKPATSLKSRPTTETEEVITTHRGRERVALNSYVGRKGSRSLSPLKRRDGGEEGTDSSLVAKNNPASSPSSTATSCCIGGGGGGGSSSRKWRMRDLLLFRSASEGRATGRGSKDPLLKYSILASSSSSVFPASTNKKAGGESIGSGKGDATNNSARRRTGPAMSAHEMHYTENRAASKELKKRTALPYRQGILECLRYKPAVSYRKP